MLNQPIAVLGGGNAGHTFAADLSLAGYKVNFYEHPQFKDAFRTTLEKAAVEIEDQVTGRRQVARIHKVTTDMKEAITDVRLIILAVPAFGHDLFFNTMIPHLGDGQVLVISPGNFGSLRLRKLLDEKAIRCNITVYELNTMPYGTRLTGPSSVSAVYGFGPWFGTSSLGIAKKVRLICALPAKDTPLALKEFLKLYPLFSPAENVLVTALNNGNFIIHPAAAVLNAGRIEYANLYANCEFRLRREGHTPAVNNVEAAIADEMAALVSTLGGKTSQPRTKAKDDFEWAQTHNTALGPQTLKHRYITEDVPYGLVPMSELGEKLEVPTPTMNAIITIASVLNQEDYRKTGRTLESLGLAELSKEQIIKFIEHGSGGK